MAGPTSQFTNQRISLPRKTMECLGENPLYKRIMQRLKVRWIGLKLNPSLLWGLQEVRNQAEEQK